MKGTNTIEYKGYVRISYLLNPLSPTSLSEDTVFSFFFLKKKKGSINKIRPYTLIKPIKFSFSQNQDLAS